MSILLSNANLELKLKETGAEMTSLISKNTGKQWLWNGNASVWNRHAPHLFPIVGSLRNDKYSYDGKVYNLPRHGFARDADFEIVEQKDNSVEFELRAEQGSLFPGYPFPFSLRIVYTLHEKAVSVRYYVKNIGDKTMFYSLGAHPGFTINHVTGQGINHFDLEFSCAERLQRHLLTKDGLHSGRYEDIHMDNGVLHLTDQLFMNDAIIIENCRSEFVVLRNEDRSYHLRVSFSNFPHLGIWKKPYANFICIEPWAGLADKHDASGELTEKEGIMELASGGEDKYQMIIEIHT